VSQLWHYTCSHSLRGITADHALRPRVHPLMPTAPPMIWLTDLDEPDRLALGLTSISLRCDRTEHRIAVNTDRAVRWPTVARQLAAPAVRRQLELAPGALPMHWWIVAGESLLPVEVDA
jgi:hypothetical protein